MNRSTLYALGCIAFCIIAGGLLYWYMQTPSGAKPMAPSQTGQYYPDTSSSQATAPGTAKNSQDVVAVQAAFTRANAGNIDHIVPKKTVIKGEYSLVSWQGDNSGGTSLMHLVNQEWVQVSITGGIWNVAGLHDLGVPQTTTLALLQELKAPGQ